MARSRASAKFVNLPKDAGFTSYHQGYWSGGWTASLMLADGYPVVNRSWDPMYIIGGYTHTFNPIELQYIRIDMFGNTTNDHNHLSDLSAVRADVEMAEGRRLAEVAKSLSGKPWVRHICHQSPPLGFGWHIRAARRVQLGKNLLEANAKARLLQ
jgi:hypothetical protein